MRNDPESERDGHYVNQPGSILNAYREGDVSFDDAVKEIRDLARPAPTTKNAPTQWAYDQACAALHKHEEAEKALREAAKTVVDNYESLYPDFCTDGLGRKPCPQCQSIINLRALLGNETEGKV
jgi:hypothetical protein